MIMTRPKVTHSPFHPMTPQPYPLWIWEFCTKPDLDDRPKDPVLHRVVGWVWYEEEHVFVPVVIHHGNVKDAYAIEFRTIDGEDPDFEFVFLDQDEIARMFPREGCFRSPASQVTPEWGTAVRELTEATDPRATDPRTAGAIPAAPPGGPSDCRLCYGRYPAEELLFRERDGSCDLGPVCLYCYRSLTDEARRATNGT